MAIKTVFTTKKLPGGRVQITAARIGLGTIYCVGHGTLDAYESLIDRLEKVLADTKAALKRL